MVSVPCSDQPSSQLSTRVIEAVADATGRSPTELPQLYPTVDLEALDELFADHADGHVRFTYAGCEVVVAADGEVSVSADDELVVE